MVVISTSISPALMGLLLDIGVTLESQFIIFAVYIFICSIFVNELQKVSPDYMKWFPSTSFSDFFLAPYMFVLGWFFSGIGVIGQPHVID